MLRLLIILVLAGIIVFFTPLGRGARISIDNKINPITKQGRVLGAATENLKKIQEMAKDGSFGNMDPAKFSELNSLLADTSTNLQEAQTISEKGDAVAAIGGLISSIIPDKKVPSCTAQ